MGRKQLVLVNVGDRAVLVKCGDGQMFGGFAGVTGTTRLHSQAGCCGTGAYWSSHEDYCHRYHYIFNYLLGVTPKHHNNKNPKPLLFHDDSGRVIVNFYLLTLSSLLITLYIYLPLSS